MSTQHAIFSPSASKRWLNCTASINFIESLKKDGKIPTEDTASIYAQEGTQAHEIAEATLRQLILNEPKEVQGDEDMEQYALEYADYISIILNEKYKDDTPRIATEQRVTLPTHPDECFGTVDCYIRGLHRFDIFDYKYGKGVTVKAKDNTQLLIYALCLFNALNANEQKRIKEVGVHIVQPRINNIDEHYISVEELKAFGVELEQTINNIKASAFLKFNVGAFCKFCPALCQCREYANNSIKGVDELKDINTLSNEEYLNYIDRAEELHAYITKLKNHVTETIKAGGAVKGFKLVAGARRRTITDQSKAIELLEGAGFTKEQTTKTELKGLTELEKLCGKKVFSETCASVIDFKEGQPVLAKEDDKRPSIETFSIPKELL